MPAARADANQIAGLDELVGQMEGLMRDCPSDRDQFRTIDLRFHLLVMKASGHDVLVSTHNAFTRQIALVIEVVRLDDIEAHALPTMRAVVVAIKRRSPPEARLAMASHIYPLISLVERFFEGQPSQHVRLWLPEKS